MIVVAMRRDRHCQTTGFRAYDLYTDVQEQQIVMGCHPLKHHVLGMDSKLGKEKVAKHLFLAFPLCALFFKEIWAKG